MITQDAAAGYPWWQQKIATFTDHHHAYPSGHAIGA
jgi:hypothetical protein